ncbi:MAG: hypothetical protein U0P45_14385 [Acidimicrobiales bacterium]
MGNPKLLAAVGMTAALAVGGVAGAALGNPLASGASTRTGAPTTTTAPPKGMPGSGMPGGGMPGGMPGKGGHGFGLGAELDAAAKALGMSTDELRAELAKGKSLAEVAEAKGVPKQDLIDALVKAAEAHLDELKASLPDLVAKAVDAKPPTGGPGGGDGKDHGPGGKGPWGGGTMPGGGKARPGMGFGDAAKVLGMTDQQLWEAVRGGKTLAQIAKDKGIDPQKVIDALVADAKAHLDQAVADGHLTKEQAAKRLDQITKGIATMVNDGFQRGMPRHN